VNNFNDIAKDTLDEWVYFLKNSEINDDFKAKGLKEAKEKMRIETMPEEERNAYERFKENRRIERDVLETAISEKVREIVVNMIEQGLDDEIIAKVTKLSINHISLIKQNEI
jgi:ethanolamine ammonia-lyase large subunit